jgi:hypothetical protein
MGLKGYRLWVNLIQRAEPHHGSAPASRSWFCNTGPVRARLLTVQITGVSAASGKSRTLPSSTRRATV